MKNGNLYQELKSAKKDDRIAWAKRNKVILAMEKELEEATRPVTEKYASILKTLKKETSEKNHKVWDIGGIYHDYGSFNRYYIIDMFAIFLTYIEGERYIPFSSLEALQNNIIIKEEISKQYDNIDDDTLDRLYKNGDLIMLANGFSNTVAFYDYVGEPNYSFGEFNYLREFVNRLIQYRIDNDKKNDITTEELYSFICNFILTHPDLSYKNKDKREQMLIEKSKEDALILECKKLEKSLKNSGKKIITQ